MTTSTQYESQPTEHAGTMDVAARLEELRADLAHLTAQVQEFVQSRATELRHGAAETTDSIEGLIRDNPLPAVGIALGAGFILGLLARGGQPDRYQMPRLTRRDVDRLASRLTDSVMSAGERTREVAADTGDKAFLERLAGALSGLLESSRETVASVGSAGAKSVAAMGEKTARSIADRLSAATR